MNMCTVREIREAIQPCKSFDEVFERSEGKEPEVFAELAAPTRSRRTENHITGSELSCGAWYLHS